MSDPTAVFTEFVNVFERLVDPDEGKTLAAITPILGDQANLCSLDLISKLLTSFFFDSVDLDKATYVSIRGIRIPCSAFRFLKELVSETPPGALDTLANHLAIAGTDVVFPDSFVGHDIVSYLTDGEYSDTWGISGRMVDEAKIKLHMQATGSTTNVAEFVRSANEKLRLSDSIPGSER